MSGYTKLFNAILASTVWREDDKTRIVWITLLAMCDRNGIAECSIPGLADLARVSIQDCDHALKRLQTPDEWSRSKEHEGRRIKPVDGGYLIINYAKHREKMSADERREYLRKKQAEYRARKHGVNNVSDKSTKYTHTEAEGEAEAEAKAERSQVPTPVVLPASGVIPPAKPAAEISARSKRPIFSGQRLTVFEWMLDDCCNILGPHLEAFDIHEWFFTLDQRAVRDGLVIPKRDSGAWLQAQLVAEAQRRGIGVRMATTSGKTAGTMEALQRFAERGAHDIG